MNNEVELHPAFVWDCDECGRENYERVVVTQLDDETMQQLREEEEIPEWEGVDYYKAPKSVTCKHCSTTFETYIEDTE